MFELKKEDLEHILILGDLFFYPLPENSGIREELLEAVIYRYFDKDYVETKRAMGRHRKDEPCGIQSKVVKHIMEEGMGFRMANLFHKSIELGYSPVVFGGVGPYDERILKITVPLDIIDMAFYDNERVIHGDKGYVKGYENDENIIFEEGNIGLPRYTIPFQKLKELEGYSAIIEYHLGDISVEIRIDELSGVDESSLWNNEISVEGIPYFEVKSPHRHIYEETEEAFIYQAKEMKKDDFSYIKIIKNDGKGFGGGDTSLYLGRKKCQGMNHPDFGIDLYCIRDMDNLRRIINVIEELPIRLHEKTSNYD